RFSRDWSSDVCSSDLFAIAFIILFTIGGFSGLMLALVPADFQYQDTFFVVAHFHYVLVTGALFAIIAAAYCWLPKWTGNMYNELDRKSVGRESVHRSG